MKVLNYAKDKEWVKSIIQLHLDNNESVNLPYHNLNHSLVVASSVIEACEFFSLSEKDIMEGVCAGLFHDFGHSGGRQNDEYNVNKAISVFQEWNKQHKKFVDEERVIMLIRATQYPYIKDRNNIILMERIIRDADMSQILHSNRIQQCYLGVGKELGFNTKDSLLGTLKFIETIDPNTKWFRLQWETEKIIVKRELDILLSIYR